jgi:hypothetical protein
MTFAVFFQAYTQLSAEKASTMNVYVDVLEATKTNHNP